MSNIFVELVYALPNKQYLFSIKLKYICTVKYVIERSEILKIRPDINLKDNKIGIYGRFVKLTDFIQPDDRIEIYRKINISSTKKKY
ncbi:MAG: RnfH family protein [Pantoea sp. Brub]|nr:RnfH family protein [Pantoea sp. Brub]